MRARRIGIGFGAGLALLALVGTGRAQDLPQGFPQGTAFTYQGRLDREGSAVQGRCDFRFRLYDGPEAARPPFPAQVGATQSLTDVPVTDGLFTVTLDFGGTAFGGQARWLRVEVGCPSPANTFTALSPWQPLTPAPGAIYAATAGSAGALQGRRISVAAPSSGQVLKWDGSAWAPAEDLSGDLSPGSVGTGMLADGAVTGPKLAAGAVGAGQLSDGAVTRPKLASGAVGAGQLADAAVTGPKLASGSVDGAKIADGSVKAADADTAELQRRVTGSCASGQALRAVDAAGGVTCEAVGGAAGWSLSGNAGTNPATNYLGTSDSQALVFRTAAGERMRILTNGNVGIGSANPQARLEIAGGALALNDGMLRLRTGPDANHGLLFSAAVDGIEFRGFGGFRWSTGTGGASERMRMDASGNLGIGGAPNAAYKVDVNGVIRATNVVFGSDRRLKTEIRPLAGALDDLERIHGVSFAWRPEAAALGYAPGARDLGLVAQDVAAVYPELVVSADGMPGADGVEASGYLAVDYARMAPVLVEALKQLRSEKDAEIERLGRRNAAQARRIGELEGRLVELEGRLTDLEALQSAQDARLSAIEARLSGTVGAMAEPMPGGW